MKWAFTTLPPAGFEVEKRFEYLRDKTQIRKVGVLHDPTPYANLQKSVAEKIAGQYGIEVVDTEQYKQDDADLTVQLSKMQGAGAGAVLKIGLGGTTLTAAKNLKQINSPMLLLTSLEDIAVFKPVAEVLGDRFFFVAAPSQVRTRCPPVRSRPRSTPFWCRGRPSTAIATPTGPRGLGRPDVDRGGDRQGRLDPGPAVRDALEALPPFQGTTGVYTMSPTVHQGITKDPFVIATIVGGKVRIVQ